MKHSCELVKDLLPLYHDGVCSEHSRQIIEEHISECEKCKNELRKIDDETLEAKLTNERDNVVGRHAEKFKRKSLIAGISIASVMAVPIVVSLIVNLATGHALDWFFIVLTSLMVAASVSVVPMVAEQRKGLWTVGSFAGSLTLLLLTVNIYSGGNWFFVAVIPSLFGLSVLFLPVVMYQLPLTGFISRHKGLIIMTADTLLLYATIIISGIHGSSPDYWRPAILITSACVLFPWALFAIIRYARLNGFIRAGICSIIGGVFLSTVGNIVSWILDAKPIFSFSEANLFVWNYTTTDANVFLITLLTGLFAGIALLTVGFVRNRK
ncbi:MAG: zf-HC2 domain-containing protein [Oscillospiraceae bacterium]|nr:zf-HC2 domain-containing protein [Oscillospiraceae bacterium]